MSDVRPDPVIALLAPAAREAHRCINSFPEPSDAGTALEFADTAYAHAARQTPATLEGVATLAAALLAVAPWTDLVDDDGELNFAADLARTNTATLEAGLLSILRGLAAHGAVPPRELADYAIGPDNREAIFACLPDRAA